MRHILIIEDEQEIAETLEYAIRSEGLRSTWVSRGSDAKHALDTEKFDLCVLDIGLPDCSGFELLKDIRQNNSAFRDIPVLMLTARNEEIDRIVGLEIGADDYVAKPFSPREVVARIKAILKRTTDQTTTEIGISTTREGSSSPSESVNDHLINFRHDSQRLQIYYQEKLLNLTKAEYSLLSLLIKKPKQVFSRRQLIEHVWSSQHPSDDRAIDTHIKTLRAKLRTHNPHTELIITHRGFGYSLEL